MPRQIRDSIFILLALLTMLLVTTGRAQDSAEPEEPTPGGAAAALQRDRHSQERDFVLNIASDQKSFWTSPQQIRLEDAHWLLPPPLLVLPLTNRTSQTLAKSPS